MSITLGEVAKLAGVSRTTASRVANGRAGVSPTTRERVLRVIRDYGYSPNPAARALALQRPRKQPRENNHHPETRNGRGG